MTIEEAGEEILRGPHETCPKCELKTLRDDITKNVFNICNRCNGFGVIIRAAFVEAATVLDVPVPAHPGTACKGPVHIEADASSFVPPSYYDD